ncbi:CAP domain-containing protein [Catenulispora rubra]|uniref:CAP domain-containing protein n=1 Tax=Catenulispora rubra TaxID=280293 RepID=UPI0018921CC3|nr:CAP domain-containing protein [Catenulispora rubra]
MASVLDAGERYDRPRRPTSHRRRAPRRHRGLRRPVITAVVGGLAIVTPLLLRPHVDTEVALGPGSSAPVVPPPASSSGSTPSPDPKPTPSADASSVTDGRSTSPVSRDATRSSSPLVPSRTVTTTATTSTSTSTSTAAAYEAEVVTLTNDQRVAHGCPALRDDPRLRAAAIAHSVDMRARNYFAHNTPDGVTPWTRIEAQGYSDPSAENIAMGQQTPQSVVDAWMNSPGHRANILNCSSKAIGVGVQFGPNGPWWTQDFGYS